MKRSSLVTSTPVAVRRATELCARRCARHAWLLQLLCAAYLGATVTLLHFGQVGTRACVTTAGNMACTLDTPHLCSLPPRPQGRCAMPRVSHSSVSLRTVKLPKPSNDTLCDLERQRRALADRDGERHVYQLAGAPARFGADHGGAVLPDQCLVGARTIDACGPSGSCLLSRSEIRGETYAQPRAPCSAHESAWWQHARVHMSRVQCTCLICCYSHPSAAFRVGPSSIPPPAIIITSRTPSFSLHKRLQIPLRTPPGLSSTPPSTSAARLGCRTPLRRSVPRTSLLRTCPAESPSSECACRGEPHSCTETSSRGIPRRQCRLCRRRNHRRR